MERFSTKVSSLSDLKELLITKSKIISNDIDDLDDAFQAIDIEKLKQGNYGDNVYFYSGETSTSAYMLSIQKVMSEFLDADKYTDEDKRDATLYFRAAQEDSFLIQNQNNMSLIKGSKTIRSRCKVSKSCAWLRGKSDLADRVAISPFYKDAITNETIFSMATPVYHNKVMIGDLVYDVNLDTIDTILNSVKYKTYKSNGLTNLLISNYNTKPSLTASYTKAFMIDNRTMITLSVSYSSMLFGYWYILLVILALVLITSHSLTNIKKLKIAINESNKDSLTGLFNRRYLDIIVGSRDLSEFIVASIDGNNIKKINDQFGHESGDKAILTITNTLVTSLRNDDLIFRVGGDEFIVLLKLSCKDKAIAILDRVNIQLIESTQPTVSISFGLARISEHASFQDAMKHSDEKMYQQKHQSKRAE
ncbi:GGDEF domain-containing protein [Vibrio splendidus]|nr:GGDEF domain-containing protein [Vibrio splendidus]MCC4880534.1 GGDEF domain-containing protein [Vibrio splendidus]